MLIDEVKSKLGKTAADLVKDGMLVGLGTGSTAAYFIAHLAERCRQGLSIQTVATSSASEKQAKEEGMKVLSIDEIQSIDLTVDGADYVSTRKKLIKGLGGALFREKIIASASQEMIVIVNAGKMSQEFSDFILPIEVNPFGYLLTEAVLNRKGFDGAFRRKVNGELFVTDNGNYMYHLQHRNSCLNPEIMDKEIQEIIGVLETGFFFDLAQQVIVGDEKGQVQIHS